MQISASSAGVLWLTWHSAARYCGVVYEKCFETFSESGYVSTNMILIAVGIAVIGVVLLGTCEIVCTLIALLKDKIKY
jgi:hypothetical protein